MQRPGISVSPLSGRHRLIAGRGARFLPALISNRAHWAGRHVGQFTGNHRASVFSARRRGSETTQTAFFSIGGDREAFHKSRSLNRRPDEHARVASSAAHRRAIVKVPPTEGGSCYAPAEWKALRGHLEFGDASFQLR